MKKILKWFKKRPINKMVIIVSIVAAIVQFVVGNVPLAVSHLLIGLAWVAIDSNDGTIEVHGNTIRMLVGGLADKREEVLDGIIYLSLWMHKYMFAKAKLDFINGRISGYEFGKQYNYYSDKIEQDIRLIEGRQNRKEAQYENDSNS